MKKENRRVKERGSLRKSGVRTTIALFGGAAMLASAIGCESGTGISANERMAPNTASSSVWQANPLPAPQAGTTDDGGAAALHGCIIGLNCGCVGHRNCGRPLVPMPLPAQEIDVPRDEPAVP
ncbi:hypothetical protein [Mycobacterium sp. 94-17]|uniref:hypothetical protein n=1 Tax=Mycobacterium sp. 94-17 TaxID=2986147 RepID=UPI002D1F558E|nr:hypothetical protein [Mycobacterium sp. 94-17]MEB4210296.1 hypothetical protein [Mycobacterium sp. 94-17]